MRRIFLGQSGKNKRKYKKEEEEKPF